jgi:hypothetical protein
MPFEFVQLEASEQPALREFLVNSFAEGETLTSFRPEVLTWKYFSKHPDWPGVRSFVVKDAGRIVAHGGVWPVRLRAQGRELRAIHLIDWAASRAAVGAGVYLLRKIAGLADLLINIGGSQDTLSVLPKLGYKRCGELLQYARVIRPWLHLRTTAQKNWKLPMKFFRDVTRTLAAKPAVWEKWTAEKLSTFSDAIEPEINGKSGDSTISLRSVAQLNHLLSCPAAEFSGYLVREKEQLRAFFLLATMGHQARIVDVRLIGNESGSWAAICNLAASAAAADPNIAEITAASSVAPVQQAWSKAGYSRRQMDKIFSLDPRALIAPNLAVDLSLIDTDLCIVRDPKFPYLL